MSASVNAYGQNIRFGVFYFLIFHFCGSKASENVGPNRENSENLDFHLIFFHNFIKNGETKNTTPNFSSICIY